mmetsp:Transcript_12483/g.35264  ORF Transcript_12483/g.35264 Transcript_12483/m.35264 type:complete len:299 (-) Transcript_12483:86-982(-)
MTLSQWISWAAKHCLLRFEVFSESHARTTFVLSACKPASIAGIPLCLDYLGFLEAIARISARVPHLPQCSTMFRTRLQMYNFCDSMGLWRSLSRNARHPPCPTPEEICTRLGALTDWISCLPDRLNMLQEHAEFWGDHGFQGLMFQRLVSDSLEPSDRQDVSALITVHRAVNDLMAQLRQSDDDLVDSTSEIRRKLREARVAKQEISRKEGCTSSSEQARANRALIVALTLLTRQARMASLGNLNDQDDVQPDEDNDAQPGVNERGPLTEACQTGVQRREQGCGAHETSVWQASACLR